MKSLKDEIKESWKNFSDPMKQAIKNLGDTGENISDTILDKMDDIKNGSECEEVEDNQPREKGGCFKKVLVYGFIFIAIIAFLRNGCSFNSTIERDDTGTETTYWQTGTQAAGQNLYDMCIKMTENNIAELAAQEPIDTDALEEEFEFLLTCLTSEYMFKSMAYGHFSGDYEETQYDHISKKCGEILAQMKKYVDEDIADSMYTAISLEAYKAFDDTRFDYNSCLIGTEKSPDIDTMWKNYFNALISE